MKLGPIYLNKVESFPESLLRRVFEAKTKTQTAVWRKLYTEELPCIIRRLLRSIN
jgi:hypothetical protein